ncbi:MAG: hypothetical protein FJY20_02460 [Bacteroidetes bacterium]|nr:hypothetical protein [Bacteroidota bacterium]
MISSWFGGSVFWIKFWPALFGSLTLIVTCLIAAEFGGNRFAQFVAGLAIITGAFLRVHALFQPNILDFFFWTLSIYFLVRFLNSGRSKFIFLFALALAMGFLSKYSVVFLAASLVFSLLITKHRAIFAKKKTYIALLFAMLIILPNVWWQYNHKWPLVNHMKELRETQLQFLNPVDFIKDQLLFLIPVVFVWITGLVWLFKNRQWRFLFFTYFFVILLLLLGRGKSYYSLGIYPALLAAGAVTMEKWSAAKQWLRYAMVVLILTITLPFLSLLLPVWKPDKLAAFYKKYDIAKTGLLTWEDGQEHSLPMDFADMLGWKELTEKAEVFYHSLPDTTVSNTIIYCRNYGQAGALKYYGEDEWFKASTITDNGSFLLWIPGRLGFRNLLFIGNRMPDKDDEVFQHFEKATVIDSVTNKFSRQYRDKNIFFENIDSAGLQLTRKIAEDMKAEFKR